MPFEQAARSHVGRKRKNNEDAMLSLPGRALWAVADGMGGHAAGDVASALVVQWLSQLPPGAGKDAVRAAIEDANQTLWEMGQKKGRTMGSTVVALAAEKNQFSCLWVGDSRAYRWRDGVLQLLTHDHSLVQQLVDAGDLALDAAANHPNANIITRAVGSGPRIEIDGADGEIAAGDVFLLASDGLTRLLSEDEMAAAGNAGDLNALADRWVETVLGRGAPDNLTFILLRAV
jgi:serine/threonine protein phosphatase PrpC